MNNSFVLHLTDLDTAALEAETASLLLQRMERSARQTLPGLAKLTDRLQDYAARGPEPGKRKGRYRIYGLLLLILGLALLIFGLLPSRSRVLIILGTLLLSVAMLELLLSGSAISTAPPTRQAKELLKQQQTIAQKRFFLRFDDSGLTFTDGHARDVIVWGNIHAVYTSAHLWLLIIRDSKKNNNKNNRDTRERALLLQKSDLVEGSPDALTRYLQKHVSGGA